MPSWQVAYLERERTRTSDSGVIYVDLPRNERISMLMVEFLCSNTSPSSRLYSRTILDVVKSVSVLGDGAKSIYYMEPEVGSFAAFDQMGRVPDHNIRERGETVMRLPIIFGRYPGDDRYGLDTSLFKSAQLQIDYELNTTYETTGTTEYTVWYLRPLEPMSFAGFVRSRIQEKYTSSGSAETKQLDLPTRYPLILAGLRVWDIDAFVENNLTDVDVNLDQGRFHMFDGRIEDLKVLNNLWYGKDVQGPRYWALTQNGQQVQHMMADPEVITWSHYAAGAIVYGSSAIWSNRHTIIATEADGTASTTNRDFIVRAVGGHPFSCFALGRFPEEPFPMAQYSDAFVELEIGAYTCEFTLFVQELITGGL